MKKHGWVGQTPLWGLEEVERRRAPVAMSGLRAIPVGTPSTLSSMRNSRGRDERTGDLLRYLREEIIRRRDGLEPISVQIDDDGNLILRSDSVAARVKPRPRTTQTGHVYMPQEYTDWKKEVSSTVARFLKSMPVFQQTRLELRLWVWTGRGDVDNLAGGLMDALNGIVWRDDEQIADLYVSKRPKTKGCPRWVAVVGMSRDD